MQIHLRAWLVRLGFPTELREQLHPIAEMDAVDRRTHWCQTWHNRWILHLNPRVDDIPERFSVVHKGVRLLEMGSVDMGGSGCICPEAAMLKTLFTHLLFRKDEVLDPRHVRRCGAPGKSNRGFCGCHVDCG